MENYKTDYVVMGQLLQKYYNEKGLDYTAGFDLQDFEKWSEDKHIFDGRTSEEQKSGGGKITSLKEILNMTQEEADENGVGEYRRIYLQKQEEEMGKQVFMNGQTYEEVVQAYMKERGITDLPDDKYDFVEWLDTRTHEQLIKEHAEVEKKEIVEIYNIMDRYCQENGYDNIDCRSVEKWCKANKIPIPSKLKKYIKYRQQQEAL